MMMFKRCEKKQFNSDQEFLWRIHLSRLSFSSKLGTQHFWPVGLRGPLKVKVNFYSCFLLWRSLNTPLGQKQSLPLWQPLQREPGNRSVSPSPGNRSTFLLWPVYDRNVWVKWEGKATQSIVSMVASGFDMGSPYLAALISPPWWTSSGDWKQSAWWHQPPQWFGEEPSLSQLSCPFHRSHCRSNQPDHDCSSRTKEAFIIYHSNNVKVAVFVCQVLWDLLSVDQLFQKAGPLILEPVSSSERTIPSNDHQVGDSFLQQILCSLDLPLPGLKIHAPCRPNHSASPVNDAWHWSPVCLHNVWPPVDHALIALLDKVDLATKIDAKSDNCSHGSIHPLGISSASQHCNAFSLLTSPLHKFSLNGEGDDGVWVSFHWDKGGGAFAPLVPHILELRGSHQRLSVFLNSDYTPIFGGLGADLYVIC